MEQIIEKLPHIRNYSWARLCFILHYNFFFLLFWNLEMPFTSNVESNTIFNFASIFPPLLATIANLTETARHLNKSRKKKYGNIRMLLYGSFYFYIEGRHKERRREVYTQRTKLININVQEGSCREQRKPRKKNKDNQTRPPDIVYHTIVSWCSSIVNCRDVTKTVLVKKKKKKSDWVRIVFDNS